jgi:alginate O-acetyltransferase complex protein AlgI
MLFSTYDFIFLFLPLAVVLRVAFWDSRFTQAPFAALVLLSLLFYGWWNPANLWIIVASILFNYLLGVLVQQHRQPLLVVVGIAANLVFLGFFKYRNFVIENISLTAAFESAPTSLIIPLGISFFTFHQIAWLIESYQGRTKSRDFLRYCLFITFFPQLIAGPILRPSELIPQFDSRGDGKPLREHLAVGFSIFIVGLGKKVLIADRLSPFADFMFANATAGNALGTLNAWAGLLAYTLQIYFDFSAYSDMAIGLARMYGIDLPINFNSPYKARSVQDFWRRWHITLSRFLRDYLYIPLGGNAAHSHANLLATMLLGGLWHGANWTFLAWGGLHGLFLVINRVWQQTKIELPIVIAVTCTFVCVTLSWVLFRAEHFEAAVHIYRSLFGHGPLMSDWIADPIIYGVPETAMISSFLKVGLSPAAASLSAQFALICGALLIAILAPNTGEIFQTPPIGAPSSSPAWSVARFHWRPNVFWFGVVVTIFLICFFFMRRQAPFLYFQF